MCGIAGFFSKRELFTKADLEVITNILSHRGPDASGFFFTEKVGLGHRRLSIIDLSQAANQPMFSDDQRYVIVFNGEIYNFQEIRKKIMAVNKNFSFKTTSDTEVLLEAFSLWKEDFLNEANGMFSIVIYDQQDKQLYLFRDRLGKKPLYYYWDADCFVFSSELKSFLQLEKIRKRLTLNRQAIYHFLYLGYIPEPDSIFNEIKKFPAGCYGMVKDQLIIRPYWKPEENIRTDVIDDLPQAKKQLKELLFSAVSYRMISDVPFGTLLSGGIDSSLVTAIAQQLSVKPIQTFSIGFDNKKFNEAPFAKQVASYLKTNHHELRVTERDALCLTEELITIFDEPFADSSAIPTALVSKLARQHVTMVLSGDGGDELFLGYGMYQWAQRLHHPLLQWFRKPISFALSLINNRTQRAALVLNYLNKNKLKSHIFSQEQYLFSEKELKKLLRTPYTSSPTIQELYSADRKLSAAEEQALFDINYYLKDDLLVKVDRSSMRYSLETRSPLLDYRIVELALNISPKLKLHKGISKYILKEILYDFVPQNYFDRPKWGFSIPLQHWLANDLKHLIPTFLNKKVIEKHGVVNTNYVESLIHGFLKQNRHYLYNRVWVLILLHSWLEKNNY